MPPAAPRCGPSGGATAPHVCWAGDTPTGRPMALIIGTPGGPVDTLIADPDVTTFLNDRFEARFLPPGAGLGREEHTLLLDPAGCLLPGGRLGATDPTAWITGVNAALESPGPRLPPPLRGPVPGVPAGHPLAAPCRGHSP